ncbi:hypothetical protein NDU88_005818 [Pleurodeles waltl]|uniref:Secreted protein n=1 Tax=Pleurodeles waltl TaxID=8319 RepID=A0AAV7X1T9_PLEWA|nr:hypothetical protein NDU88_005818 [Pleurodeles waltl]
MQKYGCLIVAARAACRCSARLWAAAPLLSSVSVWDAKCPSLHRGGARLPGWSASRHLPLPLLTVGCPRRARDLSPSPLGSVRLLRRCGDSRSRLVANVSLSRRQA